jgi:Protein of unknown function (DUF3311)
MPESQDQRLSRSATVKAAVLLAIPILALLLVPLYARATPRLWGIPFFYWYQFLWVFLTGGLTYAAYVVIIHARRDVGQR